MTAKIGPCCLCGGRYELYGNNPDPLAKRGRCCRDCNQIVVQARIAQAGFVKLAKASAMERAKARAKASAMERALRGYNGEF